MKPIGLYICSYNGVEDTVRCIETLLKQRFSNFDIYVIDNGSIDHTSEILSEQFGYAISVIRNEENLGGSGGFDTGLQDGLKKGYPYLLLMDNDIVVDENCVGELYACITSNEQYGAVGAKVLYLDMPDKIFDFGNVIDMVHFKDAAVYRDFYDDDEHFNGLLPSDYVPATAAIFRREALLDAGTMPTDNFIYFDDIEMSYRIRQYGWSVLYDGKAKVWHRSSSLHNKKNNFSDYYFKRNRWDFFAKYIREDQIDAFLDSIIKPLFPVLYGCRFKGYRTKYDQQWYPFYDFVSHIRGKAGEGRIREFEEVQNTRLNNVLLGKRNLLVHIDAQASNVRGLYRIVNTVRLLNGDVRVVVHAENNLGRSEFPLHQDFLWNYQDPMQPVSLSEQSQMVYDLKIRYVSHVRSIKENPLPTVIIDRYLNVIDDKASLMYWQGYDVAFQSFRETYRKKALQTIKLLREQNRIIKKQ